VGFRELVVLDALSYLVSAALVATMPALRKIARPASGRADDRQEPFLAGLTADLRAGLAGLLADRVLRTLLVAGALFLLGNAGADALLVPYIVADLGASPADVGLLLSSLGGGFLLSAYIGRVACVSPRLRHAVVALLAGVALGFAGLFNVHLLAVGAGFIGLAGLAGGAFLMLQRTLLQRRAPDEMAGRISAAYVTAGMAAALAGGLLASLLVSAVGLAVALNSCVVIVVLGALLGLRLPKVSTTSHSEP
jgi:predicted MFS family arabinose efflux permease